MPPIDESKCILITGATSGIGRALALNIAKLPSQPVVIGTGRRTERLEEIEKAGIHPVKLDITSDFEALKVKVDEIVKKYPALDTVILNAGVQHEFNFKKGVDMTKLVEEMTINYLSVVAFVNYIMPHFLKLSDEGRSTSIVIMSSGLCVVPAAWVPNYSASKAALHSFTMSLRAQLHDKNISVIEIVPPLVESELHDAYGTTEKYSKFWMPLSEFTNATMDGLRKGEDVITMSVVKMWYEKFEKEKEAMVLQMVQKSESAEDHQ